MDNLDTANDAGPGELASLREEFPGFRIWRETTGERVRYVARSQRPGLNPHTVVTDDPAELRAALEPSRDTGLVPFSPATPNIARMYDYFLEGKDHYPADRAAARRILDTFPEVAKIARANRAFLTRAVRHVARQGITQYIDLGSGLPTEPNTHETARQVTPGARTAYVDSDELVLAHSRALLGVDDQIAVITGDIRDPAAILTSPALTGLIDLEQPVCVLLVSVLHFLPPWEADVAVAAFRDRIAPGSYLIISAGTSTGTDPELITTMQDAYAGTAPVSGRTEQEIAAWFDGLTLARPGLADIWAWRPDSLPRPARPPSSRARFLAGVARKPTPASSPWQL
jgi:O-methyltransferase involved in polyketide biosynthesis